MSRSLSLQVYVSLELGQQARAAASARGLSVSEWVRLLIVSACGPGERADAVEQSARRIARQSLFAMIGIDALLAGHPDHALRGRAHEAFSRKCREQGLVSGAGDGGSDEA